MSSHVSSYDKKCKCGTTVIFYYFSDSEPNGVKECPHCRMGVVFGNGGKDENGCME